MLEIKQDELMKEMYQITLDGKLFHRGIMFLDSAEAMLGHYNRVWDSALKSTIKEDSGENK